MNRFMDQFDYRSEEHLHSDHDKALADAQSYSSDRNKLGALALATLATNIIGGKYGLEILPEESVAYGLGSSFVGSFAATFAIMSHFKARENREDAYVIANRVVITENMSGNTPPEWATATVEAVKPSVQ